MRRSLYSIGRYCAQQNPLADFRYLTRLQNCEQSVLASYLVTRGKPFSTKTRGKGFNSNYFRRAPQDPRNSQFLVVVNRNEAGEAPFCLARFGTPLTCRRGLSRATWTASRKLFSRESVLWFQASFSYQYGTLSPRTSCRHVIRSGYLHLVLSSTCRFRCW